MASTPETKLRIATSVLFATGFFDAIAGRFLWEGLGAEGGLASPPPNPQSLIPNPYTLDLAGAIHLHTTYSDGAGDVPTVMEAARAAGVDFVLLCDHNTQQPLRDGWEERFPARPYLLIGTEVTVQGGTFLLALEAPPEYEPTKHLPPQAAIDEINATGALTLVSLPFDIKHPWTAWDTSGYEGLEVVNLSTLARRHINLLSLAWLLPIYYTRGPLPVLQAILTRPDAALARWDALTANGDTSIGLGALDAHALMKIGKKKYPIPSYEDSMRAVTTHVLIEPAAERSVPCVRRAIYEAMRLGRCYIAYDCLGDPRPFSFTGTTGASGTNGGNGTKVATMGERIARIDGRVTLTAQAVPGTLLRLYHRGKVVAASRNGCLTFAATEPGAYRIEGYRTGVRIGPLYIGARPWIFTNPIYVD
jgi:hypothetical protein